MASHKRSASTTTMSKMGGGSVTASTSSKAGALDPALHLPAYRKFVFPDYLTVFEVEPRFRVEEMIGEGAYGSIATACDLVDDNTPVAIKRINKVFQCRSMVKRTIRELKLLRWLSHENIIGLRRVMHPRQLRADSLYLVMEKMETDLTCVIRTNDDLTEAHHQFFAYQVVRALKYMHSANIVHRDLKPRNLLVNPNCDLKLCDFGLARVWDPRAQSLIPSPEAMRAFSKRFNDQVKERPPHLSDYVATRWYRAPEVILCPSEYGKPMDMWALGCILAELITRKPLFPGRDSMHQLALIVNAIGTPDADVFESAEAREIVASMPRKKAKPMSELVPGASPVACDLLEKLLVCNPSERLSAHEAIRHPYFQGLHWEADEPEFDGNYQELLADFAFERFSMCRADLGQILRDEILQNYAPPVAVDAPAPAVAASTENSPASEIDEAAEVEAAASGGPAAPASKPPPPASEAQEHAAAADAAPVSLAAPAQPSSQEPAPPSQPSQPLPDAAAAAAAPAPTPGRDVMPAAAAKAQSQPLPDAAPEPVPEAGGDDDNDVAINDVVGSNDTQILPAHSHRHTRTKSY